MSLSDFDREHMDEIMSDRRYDWFTARLLRLCQKADPANLERIRRGFPDVVEAYETWRDQDWAKGEG